MEKGQRHFVLVHGTCHGAWCWYKVASLLKSGGHKVTALDMAASGIHPKQVNEVRTISEYFEPLMEFMISLAPEEKVILVGHSFGGYSVTVAMERFPEKISASVFASAFMPGPDLSFTSAKEEFFRQLDSFMDSQHSFDNGLNNPPTSSLFGPNCLSSMFYQLSPVEDLTLAMLLVRPHPWPSDEEWQGIGVVTKERYGSVPRVYMVCDEDKVIKEGLQRWMIEKNSTDEVKVIPGSDHMVMFSKPQEMCSCLLEIAQKYF